ncbi:MAG: DUF4296 domain-containing protein [Prevotellaceae bacterium]|jgi:hypothetical protein|nr:DUF4296 domain-containing protein [Prevotellaceae bacterium]
MKKIIPTLLLISLISCSRYVPDSVLVDILYEMYLCDAVIASKGVPNEDSVKIYGQAVKKYGYSIEEIRKTLLHYAEKQDKLTLIYSDLSKKIEQEKQIYKPLARIEKLSSNIYTGTDSITSYSTFHTKRPIDILLEEKGVYYISANYFFYKDDSTKNPTISVWLESSVNKDSTAQKQEIALTKDTVAKDYMLRIEFKDEKYNRLKGYWLNFDENQPKKPAETVKSTKSKSKKKLKKDVEEKEKRYNQHCTIKKMLVKYSFEESDTTKVSKIIDSLPQHKIDSLIERK